VHRNLPQRAPTPGAIKLVGHLVDHPVKLHIACRKTEQKYQTTIGLKFTTHQSKHLRKERIVT
jgi:hypothetical protein